MLIFLNAPFSHFQNQIRKMEHFKNSLKSRGPTVGHLKKLVLKQKGNRKSNSSILGHFKQFRKCYYMTKTSCTCFLGHFMIPSILRRKSRRPRKKSRLCSNCESPYFKCLPGLNFLSFSKCATCDDTFNSYSTSLLFKTCINH